MKKFLVKCLATVLYPWTSGMNQLSGENKGFLKSMKELWMEKEYD